MDSNNQFLLVGPGRSGSSLLAAILAKSGADFKMPPKISWDPAGGSMEHYLCHNAYATLSKINKIKGSLIPGGFSAFYERRFDSQIGEMIKIPYLKSSKLVYLVPHIAKLSPGVKIIIVYRDFFGYAKSRHKRFGWSMEDLLHEYENAYSSALLQLSIWGGVVINYGDIINNEATLWAKNLSDLTGIESTKLLKQRSEVVNKSKSSLLNTSNVYIPRSVKNLEEKLVVASKAICLGDK